MFYFHIEKVYQYRCFDRAHGARGGHDEEEFEGVRVNPKLAAVEGASATAEL